MDKRKNNGGPRVGAGRKAKEKTVTTGFRVNAEALAICQKHKEQAQLNRRVNNLVKRTAKFILRQNVAK